MDDLAARLGHILEKLIIDPDRDRGGLAIVESGAASGEHKLEAGCVEVLSPRRRAFDDEARQDLVATPVHVAEQDVVKAGQVIGGEPDLPRLPHPQARDPDRPTVVVVDAQLERPHPLPGRQGAVGDKEREVGRKLAERAVHLPLQQPGEPQRGEEGACAEGHSGRCERVRPGEAQFGKEFIGHAAHAWA